jgi:flagellar M-ring protein FliF
MADLLRRVLDSGPPAWTGLGRPVQIALLALALGLPLAVFASSQLMTSDSGYVPLFASLTAEDAGAIVAQLRTAKTPYRIGPTGEILVPPDKVGELRLRMAMQGLPLGGGVGFEVFDKTSFGLSDFNQRVNYQRALQGELARSIGQLRGVARARVHLVMPQPSLFAERERQPSASIFLKLAPGARLSAEETRGIVHLVASSVEGLAPERVTMVDTAGRVLAAGSEAGTSHLSPRRLEIKSAVEEGIERRVQSLLDSALGAGQAVTRASAQLNFDQVERTEERFDPKPVTRQESRTIETARGLSAAPSIPAGTPTPGSTPLGAANTTNEGTRESATVSYELSRIVARTLTSPGEIERLSVAVLLNTAIKVTEGADKKEVRQPVPRPAEEIEKIRRIVMGAAGYSEARGDEVTVVEMPFDTSGRDREQALLEEEPASRPKAVPSSPVIIAAAAGAALLLLAVPALWILRRRKRQRALDEITRSLQADEARGIVPASAAGGAAAAPHLDLDDLAAPDVPEEFVRLGRERDSLRQKALGLADREPEVAAQLIRAWMVKRKALQTVGGPRDGA